MTAHESQLALGLSGEATLQRASEALKLAVRDDDSNTHCPCCGHRARNDAKSLNRYLARSLGAMVEYFRKNAEKDRVHMSWLLLETVGKVDSSCAFLRFWGLIKEEEAPEENHTLKGSRGLTGFYSVTQKGFDFVDGKIAVSKEIRKPFGGVWMEDLRHKIDFSQALKSRQRVNRKNIIVNGETE